MYYYCSICDFAIDLTCAKKEVIITVEGSKIHEHLLSLVPEMIKFTCHLCGLVDDRFPYVCNICDLSFHKDCAESTPEINYSCHPKHPLKCLMRIPSYTDGKCSFVDVNCAKNPPLFTLANPKAHEHPLVLMPQRSFVCNACGMDDDPNPYVCRECNFMIHRNCVNIPRIIKVSRHVHRIYYNQCLGAGDWKCGVCRKEINWTCGAYSCLKCPDFAIHLRCATKHGIWDGIELEETSEDTIDVKSYEVIEKGVIRHFSHEEHTLKLKEISSEHCMWCKACSYPIFSSPFYRCMECNDFILHEKCAYLPKKKIDSFYKMVMTLLPLDGVRFCDACQNFSQGFLYKGGNEEIWLDVRCGSISEPFVHESHPLHSLYINYSTGDKFCSACGDKATMVLSCDECGFFLDYKCAMLPKMVKHKNDKDHFLFLCYGEQTSEQYWCEICEQVVNPEKWFYSCNYCGITFHVRCTLGDFIWIKLKGESKSSEIYMIFNNHINRPICYGCKSRCQLPTIMKLYGYTFCSLPCFKWMVANLVGKKSSS
ncbi:uncharacterized protein LOC18010446 [Eutrema salsugineum]|uniref:uncharacterized protein LOC18010446 n=1 Tax=Eutrema salsugineum TaxID=72664 RepID=UPI000CED4540|nr:uncharacterized protein LOC18010446 [Eutrema salsugineum]